MADLSALNRTVLVRVQVPQPLLTSHLTAGYLALNEGNVGSNPTLSSKLFAPMMELAYILDSKSRFCGFDSHLGHQFLGE